MRRKGVSAPPLLCRGNGGGRGRRSFGGYFGSGDRIDLYGGQDFFQAAEDFIAVDVLHDAVLRSYRSEVQRELVAGPILEEMEVLGVALTSSFAGDGFGRAKFEIADHQFGI